MSAPVLSRLFTVQGKRSRNRTLTPSSLAVCESTIHREASSSLYSAGDSKMRPPHPTLRANPFPEVTDLFCRLPLPTLFYRPEAANLGDLMRILVRLGVRISHSIGFSRAIQAARDISNDKMLYRPFKPISGQSDFRLIDR